HAPILSLHGALPIWSRSRRDEWPWPRQSIMATAKPRSRKSRTVSKYFSIGSLRPVKTQTVPLRPAGGAQRANRNSAPSGVLIVPLTTSSGTGLAGIETSVMRRSRLGEKGLKSRRSAKKGLVSPLLNAVSPLPYHFCAGRYQCFGTETLGLHETTARPDGGRVIETVAQWRTTLCVPTISPRFIVPPSASTASSTCSIR